MGRVAVNVLFAKKKRGRPGGVSRERTKKRKKERKNS